MGFGVWRLEVQWCGGTGDRGYLSGRKGFAAAGDGRLVHSAGSDTRVDVQGLMLGSRGCPGGEEYTVQNLTSRHRHSASPGSPSIPCLNQMFRALAFSAAKAQQHHVVTSHLSIAPSQTQLQVALCSCPCHTNVQGMQR